MGRFKKFVWFLLSIALLLQLFSVVIQYQYIADLPIIFLSLEEYPLIGPFIPMFLFYSGCTLFLLVVMGLLIVLFFPVNQKYLLIQKEHSKITIEQKALESLILAEIKKISFITKATVNVKVFKKHQRLISVIKGQISSDDEAVASLEGLIDSIEGTFEQMFSLPKESVRLKLKLKPFKGEVTKTDNRKRVV
ncbi:hypothetical protein BCR24_15015 [Enterococcus ureilyticus]|uniref:Alkaline shock response membrane anchor protein AmaP n=1 Tax=Enterococcus ureilyticus TaxID=1131292 RepID=A0A1E5HC52_9ENTE|nr:alkaline shock response membrane anchor protein AmaP [Enterococcus ureilyticus]MBM7690424.1 hypothetical protein [Enterococcus ureilyticus]OEG22518.1 hypothetical protein BCR24_15015 [Enterococcus ureilyticus]